MIMITILTSSLKSILQVNIVKLKVILLALAPSTLPVKVYVSTLLIVIGYLTGL